jgi:hypothetical protein
LYLPLLSPFCVFYILAHLGSFCALFIYKTHPNTSTVRNDIVKLDNVTVTAPAAVFNSALGTGSSLTLTQGAAPSATQTAVTTVMVKAGTTSVAVIELSLNRVT